MYSMPRLSSSAMMAALIIPRSATHIRRMPKRSRKRSTTGSNALTARPSLRADRPAFGIQHDANDHSLEVGSVIFGLTAPAERRSAGAIKKQRCEFDQHHRQITKQIAPLFEQPLLDHILGASGCPGCSALVVKLLA